MLLCDNSPNQYLYSMSSKPKQEGKTIVLKGQEGTLQFIFLLSYYSPFVAENKVLEYMKQVKLDLVPVSVCW